MSTVITIIHVIVCFVLILVILLQAGRGQGLAGPSFASGNVQSLFGTRAADFLTKATSVSAICFLFTSIGLDYLEARKSRSLFEIPKQGTPIDVDAIKKALEKVKAEGKSAVDKTTAATENATTTPSTVKTEADKAVAAAASTGKSLPSPDAKTPKT